MTEEVPWWLSRLKIQYCHCSGLDHCCVAQVQPRARDLPRASGTAKKNFFLIKKKKKKNMTGEASTNSSEFVPEGYGNEIFNSRLLRTFKRKLSLHCIPFLKAFQLWFGVKETIRIAQHKYRGTQAWGIWDPPSSRRSHGNLGSEYSAFALYLIF